MGACGCVCVGACVWVRVLLRVCACVGACGGECVWVRVYVRVSGQVWVRVC